MNKDRISFFVPLEIKKGKDSAGNEELRVGGIVSTNAKDLDGEELSPEGFDLSLFKKNGYLTWNHGKNSSDFVGEPTKAEITKDNEFYIEGIVYKEKQQAKDIYNLAQILEKNPQYKRKLGWSLEGVATERDLINPRKVKKALITHVTITAMPKNPDSFLSIIKGEQSEEMPRYELEKGIDGQNYLLQVKDEEIGKEMKIDMDFNITSSELSKALSAGSETGAEVVNSQTSSGASLKTEDLEGNVKNQIDDDKLSEEEKLKKKKKSDSDSDSYNKELEKGQVYEKIITVFPDINNELVKGIYNLAVQINQITNKEMSKVTSESLDKAFEILGLATKEVDANLEKGQKSDPTAAYKALKDEGMEDDEIKKAMTDEGHSDEDIEKAMSSCNGDNLKKGAESDKKDPEDEDDNEVDDEMLSKAVTICKESLSKGIDTEKIKTSLLKKGYGEDLVNLAILNVNEELSPSKLNENIDLIKGFAKTVDLIQTENKKLNDATKEELITLIKGLGVMVKESLDRQTSLEESINAINGSLDQPMKRKSVGTTKFLEKGIHADDIQKGNGNDKVLSISKNKQQVLNLMDASIDWDNLQKGATSGSLNEDNHLGQAMAAYEGSGTINATVLQKLQIKTGYTFIK